MASLINSISSGLISGRAAKEVFEVMKDTGGDPVQIIEKKGLKQKSDPKELEVLIDNVLEENKDKVSQYKSGKDKLFGFFVGQIMKVSGGTANPQLVNDLLKKKLK
jgi:aspartyl-tRNA(Asn)/glutamyl-tRNA(Gln) amidotransferase subunit B